MRIRLLAVVLAALVASGCGPQSTGSGTGNAGNDAASPSSSTAAAPAEPASPPAAAVAAASEDCVLRMGWDPWEPYQYRNIDGEVRGLDVDLVRAILDNAGCSLETEEGRWASLVSRLQEGSIDLLAGATRTRARESYAQFSMPYRNEDFELFVRRDDAGTYNFESLHSLLENGFRIGVTEEYVYGEQVEKLRGDPQFADQFIGATVGELNYQRLLDDDIDGFLEDPFVVARTIRRRGMDKNVLAHPLAVNSGQVALMFSRVSVAPETVARVDASLTQLREDGRYDSIIDKYR